MAAGCHRRSGSATASSATPAGRCSARGDGLLLYSDGVTEAHRPRRELFGEQRLTAALRELSGAAPGAVVRRLTADLHAHAGDALGDDLCIVAARVGVAA